MSIQESKEYRLISIFYGDKCAQRSGVRLMNHIDEGLTILDNLDASMETLRAYCLHPFVQKDEDLKANLDQLKYLDGKIVALAMEYRRVANAYLSPRTIQSIDEIELSPLEEVNLMLVADKIQNQKDFNLYHKDTHPRSKELTAYFKNWFQKLGLPLNRPDDITGKES